MIEDPQQKIGRPRQLYTGATRRDYAPISRRIIGIRALEHPPLHTPPHR
jgi:hypothetical protein